MTKEMQRTAGANSWWETLWNMPTCECEKKEHFVRWSGGDSVRLSTSSKIFLPELYSL